MVRRAWIVFVISCGATTSGGDVPVVANGPPARLEGTLRIRPAGPCGGARVREDEPGPQLAPAAGQLLRVRAGDRNRDGAAAVELTTAADGTFAAELPSGRYCIVLGDRGARPTKGDRNHELACLVTEWERCTVVVDVPPAAPVAIDHQPRCWSPCYTGPPPP